MSSPSTVAHIRRAALALAALLLAGAAHADTPPVKRVADALVAEALESNLGLAANTAGVQQKQAALDAVRAEYLPQLDLQLRYSEADGGRTIEVPALGLDFRFLREREIVHFQRFGEAVRLAKERLDQKNIYFTNPSFDAQ